MQWDFEKGLLAFMAVLILAGVGVIFWQRSVADELTRKMPTAETQLARIGQRAQEIEVLKKAIKQDEIAAGSQPYAYLEDQMRTSGIGKKFQIQTKPSVSAEGYQDTVYELRPRESTEDFTREAIARFLLFIEGKTTLMKVTRLRLDASTRRGATSDDWRPLIEVTERKATGSA